MGDSHTFWPHITYGSVQKYASVLAHLKRIGKGRIHTPVRLQTLYACALYDETDRCNIAFPRCTDQLLKMLCTSLSRRIGEICNVILIEKSYTLDLGETVSITYLPGKVETGIAPGDLRPKVSQTRQEATRLRPLSK